MSESVISIKDLSKSFGDHEVLRKIDINVNAGEIICIVGSSDPVNLHCFDASISWKSRPLVKYFTIIRKSAMCRKRLMSIVQKSEWYSSLLIYLTI